MKSLLLAPLSVKLLSVRVPAVAAVSSVKARSVNRRAIAYPIFDDQTQRCGRLGERATGKRGQLRGVDLVVAVRAEYAGEIGKG